MSETLREEIRRFVLPRFPGVDLGDDQDIFALGFANSLFAMELVMLVEQLVGTKVPNNELLLDNFRTVDSVTLLAERLSGAVAPASA